jgi:hypothetical protein
MYINKIIIRLSKCVHSNIAQENTEHFSLQKTSRTLTGDCGKLFFNVYKLF